MDEALKVCKNKSNHLNMKPLKRENVSEATLLEKKTAKKKTDAGLEDTMEVVRRFMELKSSGTAKTSMACKKRQERNDLEIKAKKVNPSYRRQQSKPEQGKFSRKVPNLDNSNSSQKQFPDRLYSTLPSRPSLTSITGTSKRNHITSSLEKNRSLRRPDTDVPTLENVSDCEPKELVPQNSIMLQLINSESDVADGSFQFSDSTQISSHESPVNLLRSKSFSKAVTKKSVISFTESKRKARRSISEEDETKQEKQAGSFRRFSQDSGISTTTKSSHLRNTSVHETAVSYSRPMADHKEDEVGKPARLEKRTSFSKFKKFMSSSSSRRKNRNKKTHERTKVEESTTESTRTFLSDEQRAFSAHESTSCTPETDVHKSDERKVNSVNATSSFLVGKEDMRETLSKQNNMSSIERSPSPSKKLHSMPMQLLRSISHKSKPSPKPKRRGLRHSGSSSNLSPFIASPPLEKPLETDKSGSLPFSMRHGVDHQFELARKKRRHSEDIRPLSSIHQEPSSSKKDNSSSQKVSGGLGRHADGNKKSKGVGKLRRLFPIFRKRHISETSSVSTLSQSLPSIPPAVEQDFLGDGYDGVEDAVVENKSQMELIGDNEKVAAEDAKPHHHRGSLSYSQGDFNKLSVSEKQKIYGEVVETLSRLASTYTRRIQNRSPAPGSRTATPESSLTSQDYRQYSKQSPRSGPPSRQTSRSPVRGPVHANGKSYRKYKDEGPPALTAYYNMCDQSRIVDTNLDRIPRPLPRRRYSRHSPTGSLDSPHVTANQPQPPAGQVLQSIFMFPKTPSTSTTNDAPGDAVDGLPAAMRSPPSSGDVDLKSGSECTEADCAVRSFHSRVTETLLTATSIHGSDVDVPPHNHMASSGFHASEEPSTSRMSSGGPRGRLPSEPLDEDKLVDLLVEALCKKGDEYTRQIDLPNAAQIEPTLRSSVIRYMSRVTYRHFEHFAHRFCRNLQQLVDTSPTHPEVFPMVMVFNMTQFIIGLASSEATQSDVEHVQTLSAKLVNTIVQDHGNDWGSVLTQLHETENELTASEEPESSSTMRHSTDEN